MEVLDFQYGHNREYDSTGQIGIYADKHRVADGEVFKAQSTFGPIPRGDFLYVKWRIKQSEEVYEDRVDLKTRLPADINGYGIHFAISDRSYMSRHDAAVFNIASLTDSNSDRVGCVRHANAGWRLDFRRCPSLHHFGHASEIWPFPWSPRLPLIQLTFVAQTTPIGSLRN